MFNSSVSPVNVKVRSSSSTSLNASSRSMISMVPPSSKSSFLVTFPMPSPTTVGASFTGTTVRMNIASTDSSESSVAVRVTSAPSATLKSSSRVI